MKLSIAKNNSENALNSFLAQQATRKGIIMKLEK